MIVTVDKSTFSQIHEDQLRVNDPTNTACRLTSNSTHIISVIPLNACGTEIEVRMGVMHVALISAEG